MAQVNWETNPEAFPLFFLCYSISSKSMSLYSVFLNSIHTHSFKFIFILVSFIQMNQIIRGGEPGFMEVVSVTQFPGGCITYAQLPVSAS